MAAPDPEGFSLLAKVIAAGVAVGTPIWGFLKLWDKKADKHTIANQLQEVKNEQGLHRTYFKDVFEKLDTHQRRDEELARQIMGSMSANHSELLRELAKKADR